MIVPIIIIFLLAVMVCSNRSKISAVINKEQNHANLAALALTGLVFSTFVVALDIWAWVLVEQKKHEFTTRYSNHNQMFIKVTTVFDAVVVLVTYITLIFLVCCKLKQKLPCLGCCRFKETCTGLWILVCTCFTPLLCLASHSGYITVAWVSDTQYPGPVAYLYIISFFYYFIIFRQLYKACPDVSSCYKLFGSCYRAICAQNGYDPLPETKSLGPQFNYSAFFTEILCGVVLVAAEVMVLYSLTALRLTVAAPNDIYFAQLAVVIITGLFAYNFIYTEDEPKQFVKAFVETYRNKPLHLDNLSTAEAAGKVLGGLAFTITEQYTEDESKQLTRAFADNFTNPMEVLDTSTDAEAVGKRFGGLVYTIKHTDHLTEAIVENFKATNPEDLRLERYDAQAAGRMLGGLAFTIMQQYTDDEPKQLLKAFVENFKATNLVDLRLDNLYNATKAMEVLGGLAFKIIQQYRSNNQQPDEEARQLKKVFVETFEELHQASLNLNDAQRAGKVLGRLAVTFMKTHHPEVHQP